MRHVFLSAALILLTLAGGAHAQNAPTQDQALARKGEYLARAGDCIACHTDPGGKLFSGGRAMPTPFGTLYSTNITPDPDTGIGKWTADQFYNLMHVGRFPDSGLVYPAMPFANYTRVTRADSDAIFAYLRSVPAVHQANHANDMRFPYNNRALILGWRTLYFGEGEFVPDPSKSDEWNRGKYLVEGLGHCSMCHSPINALGGTSESKAFAGGLIPMQAWYAPSLTSNKEAGLGEWSIEDISDLLRTGVSKRGAVYGPMAEVVYDSLQYMTDEDTRAMAIYLKRSGALRSAAGGEQPALASRQDGVRYAVRQLPRCGRTRHAARLPAARGQPVDPDVLCRQSDPHGVEWRLPARHRRQSEAIRDAAFRAVSVGR
jgi:mono/diheme cytochrome c family protein